MKLGFVSAILDQSSFEEVIDIASDLGFVVLSWHAGHFYIASSWESEEQVKKAKDFIVVIEGYLVKNKII